MSELNRRDFLMGMASAGLLGAGCRTTGGFGSADVGQGEKGFSFTEGGRLEIDWPGLAETLRFWVIGDTHFAFHDERDDAFAGHYARMAQWPGSKAAFEAMLAKAQKERPDRLVLVGDNISFPSLANVEYLKTALDGCAVPWIYVSGNHDWHFEGDSGSDFDQRARWTVERLKPLYQGADPLMSSCLVKGVRLVLIDNSLYHVLPEQVDFYRAEAAKGDPVCLYMHIPLWRPGWGVGTCGCPRWGAATDPYWQIERRERWSASLLPSTFAFREAVLSTPNLVGVFAGHVHALQIACERGQNFFTTPGNANGAFLDVTIRGSEA